MSIHRIHRQLAPETPLLSKQVAKTQNIPLKITSRISSLGGSASEDTKVLATLIKLTSKVWKWILDLFKSKNEEISNLQGKVKNLKKEKTKLNIENNHLKVALNNQAFHLQNIQANFTKKSTAFTPLLEVSDDEDPILIGSISELEQSIDLSLKLDEREEGIEKREEELDKRRAKLDKLYNEQLNKLKIDLQLKHEQAEEKAEDIDLEMHTAKEIQDLKELTIQQERTIQKLAYQNISDEERKEEITKLQELRKTLKKERKAGIEERRKLDESLAQSIQKYKALTSKD